MLLMADISMCISARLTFVNKALEHLHEHKGLEIFIDYLLFVVGRSGMWCHYRCMGFFTHSIQFGHSLPWTGDVRHV